MELNKDFMKKFNESMISLSDEIKEMCESWQQDILNELNDSSLQLGKSNEYLCGVRNREHRVLFCYNQIIICLFNGNVSETHNWIHKLGKAERRTFESLISDGGIDNGVVKAIQFDKDVVRRKLKLISLQKPFHLILRIVDK